MDVRRVDRSSTDVLADTLRNVQGILRSEIRLAQSEVRDDLARTRPAAILLAVAAGAALLSGLFVLLAMFHALRQAMPAWAAGLCIAGALALASVISATAGLKRFRTFSPMNRTPAHIEESVECAKEQIR